LFHAQVGQGIFHVLRHFQHGLLMVHERLFLLGVRNVDLGLDPSEIQDGLEQFRAQSPGGCRQPAGALQAEKRGQGNIAKDLSIGGVLCRNAGGKAPFATRTSGRTARTVAGAPIRMP
jgi:hypothetical protein